MDPNERPREFDRLLRSVTEPSSRGALLLGPAGSGKSTLLHALENELTRRGRAVFRISLTGLRHPDLIGERVLEAIESSPYADLVETAPYVRSSAGALPIRETVSALMDFSRRVPQPVLLLDALDETAYPSRVSAAVEELSSLLEDWKLVLAAREEDFRDFRRFGFLPVIQVQGFVPDEPEEAAVGTAPTAAPPLEPGARTPVLTPVRSLAESVELAIETSPDPARAAQLLEEIALAGGSEKIIALAAKTSIPEAEVRSLLTAIRIGPTALEIEDSDDPAVTMGELPKWAIISSRILAPPFRLADLAFGSEEAERDEFLDRSFVHSGNLKAIVDQRRSLVIGDRGSGKSAIFRKLSTDAAVDRARLEVCPVANTGELLHRIVDGASWPDADGLRAVWLIVVASVVASALPATAPRHLRRDAADLRAAVGMAAPMGRGRRMLRAILRPLRGTSVKFAVGPVSLETQLPSGAETGSRRAAVDVESFLREADRTLSHMGRRVLALFDRIDETFKYDRKKQEAVVQSLLQAEGRVSQFDAIGVTIFLRTDLFELYDIQEKNKVVSRTLPLEWSEDQWLQVLIRRVLANRELEKLTTRARNADGSLEIRGALEMIFPPEIEGQPIDRWLIDSLRNGNGDITPRSAVLLLHLTREMSTKSEEIVTDLPLFPEDAVTPAMTKVSDLSFSEVVNDFKVGTSFVLNCRAGKLVEFALHEVADLFDETEGRISEQVRLLERLGFLERVVQQTEAGTRSLFRIPRLYTRCWDYA
ncbi:ATP-binding protein [Nocardia crassostreae]|uniref:ATP-binding protein n=1 Tax=Nocardia crassostreae TaxID=53428 RepID=UPI0008320100|nr:ATP-binding protein [Nocardia crassostreae]